MVQLRNLTLAFWQCKGIHSVDDVAELLESAADLGLVPTTGTDPTNRVLQPVPDIRSHLEAVRYAPEPRQGAKDKHRVTRRFPPWERWAFGFQRRDQIQSRSTLLSISRDGDRWRLRLSVMGMGHAWVGMTLEAFTESWCELLARLGQLWYPRARPALGLLDAALEDQTIGSEKAVEQRRLLVGWRTWYGPAYVDAFGRDWLLGLPDGGQPLEDGGVAHALRAPAAALLEESRSVYERVWPHLDEVGIKPVWPKRGEGRRLARAEARERRMDAFADGVRDLLASTIVLTGGRRVKKLPLTWSTLSDWECTLALHKVAEAVVLDLTAHPEATLHLEVGELPDRLRASLERFSRWLPNRLTYAVVPELAVDFHPSQTKS